MNERAWTVNTAPDTPLLYVLMNELQLQGPRFGCGLAQCGSCSVLVNGVETRSCVTAVSKVEGKSVTTLEGLPAWYASQRKLAKAPALHPVQQAMIDEQAVQCGYCFNGMIIKSSELLSRDASTHGSADPHRHERPSVQVRYISQDHEGYPAGFCGYERRCRVIRREFLQTGGAMIVGFSLRDTLVAQEPVVRVEPSWSA